MNGHTPRKNITHVHFRSFAHLLINKTHFGEQWVPRNQDNSDKCCKYSCHNIIFWKNPCQQKWVGVTKKKYKITNFNYTNENNKRDQQYEYARNHQLSQNGKLVCVCVTVPFLMKGNKSCGRGENERKCDFSQVHVARVGNIIYIRWVFNVLCIQY